VSTGPPDIRIALRFLHRNPTFAVASAAILALGISLGSPLFAIVRGALLEPWPYRDYDRLVTVAGNYPTQGRTGFSLHRPGPRDRRAARDSRRRGRSRDAAAARRHAHDIAPQPSLAAPVRRGAAHDRRDGARARRRSVDESARG
jgi:hypothetical protein